MDLFFFLISGLHKIATEEFLNLQKCEFAVNFSDLAINS